MNALDYKISLKGMNGLLQDISSFCVLIYGNTFMNALDYEIEKSASYE
jgi:hypothetical protein